LCGFVRNREKFPQITVIFALCGVAGSRGRNIAAALAKSPLAALKIARTVDYDSQSRFTAAFKTYFKVLPKEYRKKSPS
jgi:AraC-like DNA-binding protein